MPQDAGYRTQDKALVIPHPVYPVSRISLTHYEVGAPVQLPALFVVFFAESALFTVAGRIDAAGVESLADQILLRRIRPTVAKGEIVFLRSTLVAVTLDGDADCWALAEGAGIVLQSRARVIPDGVLVVIEERILDVVGEEFGIADCGRRRRRSGRWNGHRDSRFGNCVPTRTRRSRHVCRGSRRADGSASRGLDGSDSIVDGDPGRIRRIP